MLVLVGAGLCLLLCIGDKSVTQHNALLIDMHLYDWNILYDFLFDKHLYSFLHFPAAILVQGGRHLEPILEAQSIR